VEGQAMLLVWLASVEVVAQAVLVVLLAFVDEDVVAQAVLVVQFALPAVADEVAGEHLGDSTVTNGSWPGLPHEQPVLPSLSCRESLLWQYHWAHFRMLWQEKDEVQLV